MKKNENRTRHRLATGCATAVLLLGMSSSANAFTDAPAFAQRLANQITAALNWAETVQSYASQVAFYRATYEQYRQQLINARRLLAAGEAVKVQFKRVDLTEGMSEQCGDASFTADLVFKVTGINLEGNSIANARQVCKQIVANQNSKHNEVVSWVEDVDKLQKEYVRVLEERDNVGTEEGKLAANTNDLTSLLTKMQNRGEYMRTRMAGFDSNIEILGRAQSQLAKRALNGTGKTGGNAFGSALFGN